VNLSGWGQNSAMAMVGVLVETQVSENHDFLTKALAELTYRHLDNPVGVARTASDRVLLEWNTEEDH